jgi:signal transduction histidine kinase
MDPRAPPLPSLLLEPHGPRRARKPSKRPWALAHLGWTLRGTRLGRRLLVFIMLFSATVSLLATAVQLLSDYSREVQGLHERITYIHSSYSGTISESIWTLDEDLLQFQLQGVTALPGIVRAEVESDVGTRAVASRRPLTERDITYSFPLYHGQRPLGTLHVSVTLEDIYAQLRSRALVIFATQAAKTLLVAVFTLFIFQRLVTRHLATMAAFARGLDMNHLDTPLVIHRKPPSRATADELDEVVCAINQMRHSLQEELRERRRAEASNALLAEAGATLMESLDMEKILPRIAALCVRSLAACCVIDLIEGETVRRVGGAHVDPVKRPLMDELQQVYPLSPDSKMPAATVIKTGEPLLLPTVKEEECRALCINERHFQILRELGIGSFLAVPLIARGQRLGAITLGSASRARIYGPADLELAQELARRAAIAIDNARLYHQAEQAIRLREVFLSVAAHELRTPLLPLQLRLQRLLAKGAREGAFPEPGVLRAELIAAEHQTKRLGEFVTQLMDVSDLLSGRPLELRRKRVELSEVVEGVIHRMQRQIAFSDSQIVQELHRPTMGWWDPSRIAQVVTALLHNAVKFGQGKPILVSVSPRERSVLLRVRDHGIGMSAEEQAHIFEKFTRGVSEQHFGGLGLGLYIARWIVEAQGGTIACQSESGQGTTFTVELPTGEEPGKAG